MTFDNMDLGSQHGFGVTSEWQLVKLIDFDMLLDGTGCLSNSGFDAEFPENASGDRLTADTVSDDACVPEARGVQVDQAPDRQR